MTKPTLSNPQDAGTADSAFSRLAERLNLTPNRLWMAIFGLWLFLLTGVTWNVTGSPGFIQHYRLTTVYDQKQLLLASIEGEVTALNSESDLLEKSVVAQEREVRRTLGYAASDEIIFDFSAASTFSHRQAEALVSK